jgi:hypothetical protein
LEDKGLALGLGFRIWGLRFMVYDLGFVFRVMDSSLGFGGSLGFLGF